jgi:hypothetical protein
VSRDLENVASALVETKNPLSFSVFARMLIKLSRTRITTNAIAGGRPAAIGNLLLTL